MMKPPSPLVALRFPPEMLEEIDRLARTEFVSRSDVIRTFVREKIEERRKAA
jgi:metal-responsive CopG/Arc/MetJ family transcriptional regulator